MNMLPEIRKMAERVVNAEEGRKRLALFLKGSADCNGLVVRHEPEMPESMRIVAVDGGIVKKSLHGLDCILVRSAGVCFAYSGTKIGKVEYLPSKFPTPEFSVTESLSEIEWAYHGSLIRLRSEIRTALECIEKLSPDMLILDGSIIPHYSDRPAKSSPLYESYRELLGMYSELFGRCMDRGTMLCGVIEDSRSTRFCDIIRDKVLPRTEKAGSEDAISMLLRTKDTNLLFWMLDKGERTMEFAYSDKLQEHPVLKDFEKYSSMLHGFYLKTAKWDRPVRVEYLSENPPRQAARLASVLLSISGQHDIYGLPTPLIEADSVAKLSEAELENIYTQIIAFTGNIPSMFRLRREQRPF